MASVAPGPPSASCHSAHTVGPLVGCLGGLYEAPSNDRFDAYFRRRDARRTTAGGDVWRIAEPSLDGVRGCRVRRLSRGDGPARVSAGTTHVDALRRQGPTLSP